MESKETNYRNKTWSLILRILSLVAVVLCIVVSFGRTESMKTVLDIVYLALVFFLAVCYTGILPRTKKE